MKLKSASLDLIAKANGRQTGDELINHRMMEEKNKRDDMDRKAGRRLTCSERRTILKMIERASIED